MNAYIFGDVEAKTSFVSGKKDNILLELRKREWRAQNEMGGGVIKI